jgi:arsenite methyltransferase
VKDSRNQIKSDYTDALSERSKQRSVVAQTGSARFANYAVEQLKYVPEDAVNDSFGCGNPVAFSSIQPGQTVLDLGCGAGLDLLIAAEKVGSSGTVIGVDMTDAMLENATANIQASGLKNIQVRKGYVETLPIESDSIDWVISNCVINLSPEKDQVFTEIARVLKPGGQMIVSDIVAENLPWWVRRSGVLTAACAGGAISEARYLAGLRAAGLHDCSIIARQYYEPMQMASVVVGALPGYLQKVTCCGKPIARNLLTKLAKPVSERLWSARIAARKPVAH